MVPYIFELENAELAEAGDRPVGGLDGDYELDEAHLLGSQVIHGRQLIEELHHRTKNRWGGDRSCFWRTERTFAAELQIWGKGTRNLLPVVRFATAIGIKKVPSTFQEASVREKGAGGSRGCAGGGIPTSCPWACAG